MWFLRVLWLAAPVVVAGVLHMVVVKLHLLAPLAKPIDGGRSWRGERIFGDHKTWRGIVVMVVLSALVVGLQTLAHEHFAWARALAYYDYGAVPWHVSGAILGLGYVLAELPNSFFKRRLGVRPGATESPVGLVVDQADSVIGCVLAMYLYWTPPLGVALLVVATGTGLHLALNGAMLWGGLRRRL